MYVMSTDNNAVVRWWERLVRAYAENHVESNKHGHGGPLQLGWNTRKTGIKDVFRVRGYYER